MLEKSGLDTSRASEAFQGAKTDDTGGDGGNGGKVSNGGSGGDGDEGDDDAYNGDGDDGEDGDSFLSIRTPFAELFDQATLNCVLAEWCRTLVDLPAGLRMAVQMGLVSSLQLVRFLAVDCRPTLVRAAHRLLPAPAARAFVGRLMADPSFLSKLAVEQAITLAAGTAYEAGIRGDKLGAEADFASINVSSLLASNAVTVWLMAPTRLYGAQHAFGWQRLLSSLPNHVFDASGPLRPLTYGTRFAGMLLKGGQMALLGCGIGAVAHAASSAALHARRLRSGRDYSPSVPISGLRVQALGMGAWMGLSCTARYNLLGGLDRLMHDRLSSLSAASAFTCTARLLNNHMGEVSRLWLTGGPAVAHWGAPGRVTGVPTTRAVKKHRKAQAHSNRRKAAVQQGRAAAAGSGAFSVSKAQGQARPRQAA